MDPVIISGDLVGFSATFGQATVLPTPVTPPIIGSSPNIKITGIPVCIEGDEASIQCPCTYTKGPFVGGTGLITIELDESHISSSATNDGTPLILKGGSGTATMEVITAAVNPGPPSTDMATSYTGTWSFVLNNNNLVKVDT